jgi:PKD repeat protein
MLSNHQLVSLKWIGSLVLAGAVLGACHKKTEVPVPVQKPAGQIIPKSVAVDSASIPDTVSVSGIADSLPETVKVKERMGFASMPKSPALLGLPFEYKPVLAKATLSGKAKYSIRLVKGPDSMALVSGLVKWTPKAPGSFEVILEAVPVGGDSGKTDKSFQQVFTLKVSKVFTLSLKPLPPQINKGDSIVFDLGNSQYPAWAASEIKTRFDFEGDGKWDTEWLSIASNLIVKKAYDRPGKYSPKLEANYKNLESQSVTSEFSVISAVYPALKMSPDTVEPGGRLTVDVSRSKGDGRLSFYLDLEGDGKVDWSDSNSTKTILKAPRSGIYQSVLTVRNSMGQTGQVTSTLIVNAKPALEMKVRNTKINMATELEVRAQASDADDALLRTRINFSGDSTGWIIRTSPADSIINPQNWLLRFKHVYGKVGKYKVSLCAASIDNREACRQVAVEVFNAAPICILGEDVHASLGIPLEIDGQGKDPDGKIVKWEWDLDGDGKYDLTSAKDGKFKYTFAKLGVFKLVLRITTEDGMQTTCIRTVEVKKKWKS